MSKRFSFVLIFLLFITGSCFSDQTCTIIPSYNISNFDHEINSIYRNVLNKKTSKTEQIEKISAYFMGRKYIRGALGEGQSSLYDKSPLYRTDAFDCLTYVSTVLALVESNNTSEFISHLKKIQYKHADVSYTNRCHFTEVDWNYQNHQNYYLVDITKKVYPNYRVATALIDKPSWFRSRTLQDLKSTEPLSRLTAIKLLTRLHQHSKKEHPYIARTTYIPLTLLLKDDTILNHIPSGAIIEIVNKTRQFKRETGTDLNISHLGFAIRTKQGLMFRHASLLQGQVTEVLLKQYLQHYFKESKTPEKIGLHLEMIR